MRSIARVLFISITVLTLGITKVSGSDLTHQTNPEPSSLETAPTTRQTAKEPPPLTAGRGYCCLNGSVIASDERTCRSRKGTYSNNKQEIQKICRGPAAPARGKPATPSTAPIKGYCCSDGKVYSATSLSCERQRGTFSTSKREADKKCGETAGYCCSSGEYKASTKRDCEKVRGTFSRDRQKGLGACQASIGFCCIKGTVMQASKGQCDQKRGAFSSSRDAADKLCLEVPGYCCANGRVLSVNRRDCDRKAGSFFSDRSAALRTCQPKLPDSKTKSGSTPSTSLTHQGSQTAVSSLQPDLVVLNTDLGKDCKLRVTVKNQGGPIGETEHSEAEIYISAGPGNVVPLRQRYLRVLDPEKKLKTSGGEVTYVSDLQVTGTQATLVWLDTAHHIAESNEQNNGDDQEVSCGLVSAVPGQPAQPLSGVAGAIPEQSAPQSAAGGVPQMMGTGPVNNAEVPQLPTGLSTLGGGDDVPRIQIIPGPIVPEHPQLNQQVTASFTVKNWGSVATTGPLNYKMKIYNTDPSVGSATTVYPWHIDELDPGGEETVTLSYTPYNIGEYEASFQILLQGYSDDVVFLGGQMSYINFLVTQPYDLRVYAQAIELNQNYRLKFAVGNMGPAIPLEMYKLLGVSVRLDMGPKKIVPLTFFDPVGANLGSDFTWPSRSTDPVNGLDPVTSGPAREFQVAVGIIESGGTGVNIGPPDTNPNNNLKYKTLGGRPDLVVCYAKLRGSKPNRYTTYRPVVKNIGDAPSDIVNLRFYIKDKGTKNYTIPALSPGEIYAEVKRKVYWVFTGNRNYTLHVDNLRESFNEEWTNNILKGTIQVNTYYYHLPSQCSNEPGSAD